MCAMRPIFAKRNQCMYAMRPMFVKKKPLYVCNETYFGAKEHYICMYMKRNL